MSGNSPVFRRPYPEAKVPEILTSLKPSETLSIQRQFSETRRAQAAS
jgi:hypothetical protein